MQATVHLPSEGTQIGGPTAVTIKATGEETNGSFYLGEVVVVPGFPGPPAHVHERLHDIFYVLDGTLTLRLGDQTTSFRKAASSVCLPAACTRSAIGARSPCASSSSTRPQVGRTTCATFMRRSPRERPANTRSPGRLAVPLPCGLSAAAGDLLLKEATASAREG
jgi:hypothetical protein